MIVLTNILLTLLYLEHYEVFDLDWSRQIESGVGVCDPMRLHARGLNQCRGQCLYSCCRCIWNAQAGICVNSGT